MHKKIAGEPMEELYSQLAALARSYTPEWRYEGAEDTAQSGLCCSVPAPEGITDTTAT